MQTEWIASLAPHIIEGKLIQRVNNSVYLDSNTVTKPVTLTNNEYKSITKIVEETNSSIEEFIKEAIRNRINQHLLNQG